MNEQERLQRLAEQRQRRDELRAQMAAQAERLQEEVRRMRPFVYRYYPPARPAVARHEHGETVYEITTLEAR